MRLLRSIGAISHVQALIALGFRFRRLGRVTSLSASGNPIALCLHGWPWPLLWHRFCDVLAHFQGFVQSKVTPAQLRPRRNTPSPMPTSRLLYRTLRGRCDTSLREVDRIWNLAHFTQQMHCGYCQDKHLPSHGGSLNCSANSYTPFTGLQPRRLSTLHRSPLQTCMQDSLMGEQHVKRDANKEKPSVGSHCRRNQGVCRSCLA